eukprot:1144448-Pelagomonas_calceolata.AAC.5
MGKQRLSGTTVRHGVHDAKAIKCHDGLAKIGKPDGVHDAKAVKGHAGQAKSIKPSAMVCRKTIKPDKHHDAEATAGLLCGACAYDAEHVSMLCKNARTCGQKWIIEGTVRDATVLAVAAVSRHAWNASTKYKFNAASP